MSRISDNIARRNPGSLRALSALTAAGRQILDIPDSPYLDNKLGFSEAEKIKLIRYEGFLCGSTIPLALDRLKRQSSWGFKQLRMAHKAIFDPIYPWAGDIRQINMSKSLPDRTGATIFAPKEEIKARTENILRSFAKLFSYEGDLIAGLRKLTRDDFAAAMATLYNDINMVHPFREGNGRSLQVFCTAIARQAGYDFDWSVLAQKKNDFNQACGEWAVSRRGKKAGHLEIATHSTKICHDTFLAALFREITVTYSPDPQGLKPANTTTPKPPGRHQLKRAIANQIQLIKQQL